MTAEVVAGPYSNGHAAANGHVPAGTGVAETLPSAYLKYLPAIYWQDPFLGRFLRIFEEILSPIQTAVNRRADQFDAGLASDVMLGFLATWVGADEIKGLSDAQRRRLVRSAITLNQWRGTKRGLRMALEAMSNRRPYITEFSQGLVLGEDAVLGLNTSLQEGHPLRFHILFDCKEDEVDSGLINAIIQRYKPAGSIYSISFTT